MEELLKDFIPYDRALRLKALGFNEPCFSFYMGGFKELGKIKYVNPNNVAETNVLAPTFSAAFRWFREKYSLIAEFNWHFPSKCYATSIYPNDFYLQTKSYEKAELACLDKLLEIIESKSE